MLALVLAACGGAGTSPVSASREVPFTDHGSTARSGRDDPSPAVLVGAGARAAFAGASIPADRVAIAVFQGQQRTGGYVIKVDRIVRAGATLEVRATLTTPPPDAIVIQVLTSPAQLVSIAATDASGADGVVLVDQTGAQRASVTGPVR